MKIPEGLKYSKEHEWVKVLDDNEALIGVTDFAQSELGEIVYIEIDNLGDEVAKDDVFGTIEAVKTTSELFMPVSGEVLEFNPAISEDDGDDPALVNSDPYGEGWIVKIKLTNPDELEDLMDAEAYKDLVA
jgi:glycine cleavage system H protein